MAEAAVTPGRAVIPEHTAVRERAAVPERAVSPYHRTGPEGPWAPVRAAWEATGRVVVHGTTEEWTAGAPVPLLPPQEAARYQALRTPDARARFLGSRLLVRRTAGALLGLPWPEVRLGRTALGAPVLPDAPGTRLSLSHTGTLLAVALSRLGPVGVDAERAGRRTLPELAERICAPAELRALTALPVRERAEALIRLWTLKEAYVKALGTGLRVPLRHIAVPLRDIAVPLRDMAAPLASASASTSASASASTSAGELAPPGWQFTTRTVRTGAARTPYILTVAAHALNSRTVRAPVPWPPAPDPR
ncbi:4'-phosphopantetheinyl transferase superfamily protein [Streptomyces sp. NPDC093085]|uniref:4'-phosphopantetheinyl transferase family protein n=1 Tax=Streptomyces sp. NPDC093085 TaxID=3155068 RepID=UPI003413B080